MVVGVGIKDSHGGTSADGNAFDVAATDYDDDDDDDDDGCMSATHRCYPGAQDTPLSSRSHTLFNRLEQ